MSDTQSEYDSLECRVIARISTPFKEKFGIPRQPGLAPSAQGVIDLCSDFNKAGVFDQIQQSSHIWLLFWFHEQESSWAPKIRPPRLGGNRKVGVFASRSPRRPNPVGMSVFPLVSIDRQKNQIVVGGVDLLDQTPILDIKPYLPYCDLVPEARCLLAPEPPKVLSVHFSPEAEADLQQDVRLKELITEVLSLDPRPAYHQDERVYGTYLRNHNVRWKVIDGAVRIIGIEKPLEP